MKGLEQVILRMKEVEKVRLCSFGLCSFGVCGTLNIDPIFRQIELRSQLPAQQNSQLL